MAIHMVGTPGKIVARLTSMSLQHALDVEARAQQDLAAALDRAKQNIGQRIDMKQRQNRDDLVGLQRTRPLPSAQAL